MLTRDGLQQIAGEMLERVVAAPPRGDFSLIVRATSGTSGRGPLVAVQAVGPETFRGTYAGSARVALCFGSPYPRLTHAAYLRHLSAPSLSELPIQFSDLGDPLRALLADFGPDMVVGVPSFISAVSNHFDNVSAAGVKKLLLTGELLSANLEEALRTRFKNATLAMEYTSVEVGRIGHQPCGLLPINHYHPIPGARVEIGALGEEGEILVSKTLNPETPLARQVVQYQTGDCGRFVEAKCRCADAATFECLGRQGLDYVKLAGAILRREEFDRVAAHLNAFDDYRAQAQNITEDGRTKGKIVLQVYRKDGVGTEALAQEIGARFAREIFLTPTRTLEELVAEGVFLPLEVSFTDAPFKTGNKDIKLFERSV
jgi:phenylacetate-coenzyme A ligase PaaK-like adenylate-forming protein